MFADPGAQLLCHPTNIAFRGTDAFTANLGRWHITRITDIDGIDGIRRGVDSTGS